MKVKVTKGAKLSDLEESFLNALDTVLQHFMPENIVIGIEPDSGPFLCRAEAPEKPIAWVEIPTVE